MSFTIGGIVVTEREKVTIDHTEVIVSQADFRFPIDLSTLSANFHSKAKADGGDIRLTQTDGTTQQALEIVAIDTGAGTGLMFGKSSFVSSLVDTDLWVYYGNATASQPIASDPFGSENAYTADDVVAYNYQQSCNGTVGEILDSTANAKHATGGGGTGSKCPTRTAGGLYGTYYQDYDGTDDYAVSVASLGIPETDKLSIEMYVWSDDNQPLFGDIMKNGVEPNAAFEIFAGDSGVGSVPVYARAWDNQPVIHFTATSPTIAIGGWSHVVVVIEPSGGSSIAVQLYVDGVFTVNDTWSDAFPLQSTTEKLGIGANNLGLFPFDGRIAFTKIKEGVVVSANDVETLYNAISSPSTFYSVSAPESSPVPFAQCVLVI